MKSLPALNHISLDIMFDILARLPVKSLLRCKCVCKTWSDLINDTRFIQHHLNNSIETINSHQHLPLVTAYKNFIYTIDDLAIPSPLVKLSWSNDHNQTAPERWYPHDTIIGSCNGLVCLNREDVEGFVICNPSTRTFKLVSCPLEIATYPKYKLELGFGYDSREDDYKIVLLLLGKETEIWCYKLKADSWKNAHCKRESSLQNKYYISLCNSTFGNGMLHCILRGVEEQAQIYDETNELPQIARFNLSSEKWEDDKEDNIMSFPPVSTNRPIKRVYSSFMDGNLCLSLIYLEVRLPDFIATTEIWMMKEYGVKESWVKLFSVEYIVLRESALLAPIAYSRKRPDLLLLNTASSHGPIWYDLKHEKREKFEHEIRSTVYLCVGSLIPIPGSSQMIEIEKFQVEVQEENSRIEREKKLH